MSNESLYKILKKSESIGLLCNHTSWHSSLGQYTFELVAAANKLRFVFIPEHGLFGELQDQAKLDNTSIYSTLAENAQWVSLYNSSTNSLVAADDQLRSLDTLLIDLQDAGSRYYTYTSTIYLLLERITFLGLNTKIVILDKPNPAGRQVEGTRITDEYASFIGLSGLPHRHGLTLAELCRYFKHRLKGKWELVIFPINKKDYRFIAPSPNIPTVQVCRLYSGQCLWEGTNLSEGRGTTQPFETIGAPFLNWVFKEKWNDRNHPTYRKNCTIRPTRFIPVFHKFSNTVCDGLQLMPGENKKYHSLGHSLQLMKFIKEKTGAFEWRPGTYEALNDKTAIELLAGDKLLIDYLNGIADWKEVREKMDAEETAWIKEVSPFIVYKPSLQKLKLN
jgi:uncharacterized protein YbbC (DUF1343 family)